MKILLAVVGGLLLLIFPFIVMKKAKVTKEENTDEARKKFNVFLICMIYQYQKPAMQIYVRWVFLKENRLN